MNRQIRAGGRNAQRGPGLLGWQVRIFALSWVAYTLVYFGRMNLSVALGAMQQSFAGGKTALSLLGRAFFAMYAAGKLVNGYIGDFANNKKVIFVALLSSGVCNILLGLSKNIWVVVALWGANGVAQSAVWCNMVRLVCNWFVPRQYSAVSLWLSTSMVAGSMAALGVCGWLVGFLPWRWLFWVPGAALALFAFLWLALVKNKALDAGFKNIETPFVAAGNRLRGQKQPLGRFIITSGLLLVTVACLAQGVIKEGIGLWGPSMLQEGFSLPAGAASRLLLFIPAMNFLGIFIAAGLQKVFPKNIYAPVALLMLGGGFCLLGLRFAMQRSVWGGVLLLAATSALMYGVNAVLLSVFPLRYTANGRVSFVSGFLDCTSYMGTGAATLATGAFLDAGKGWNGVFVMWVMLVALGLLALLPLMLISKKKKAVAE